MSLLRNDKRNFKKKNSNPLFGGSKSSLSPETGNKFCTDDIVSRFWRFVYRWFGVLQSENLSFKVVFALIFWGLFKQWKHFFLCDEMFYVLFLFHPTETNRNVFAVITSGLLRDRVRHLWQLTTVLCIKFHATNFIPITDRTLWLLVNALLEGIPRKSVVYLLVTNIRKHFYL